MGLTVDRRELEGFDAALTELPDAAREAVILCYLEGLEMATAAQLAGCSEDIMCRRARAGVALLGNLLGQRGTFLSSSGLIRFMKREARAGVPARLLAALPCARLDALVDAVLSELRDEPRSSHHSLITSRRTGTDGCYHPSIETGAADGVWPATAFRVAQGQGQANPGA